MAWVLGNGGQKAPMGQTGQSLAIENEQDQKAPQLNGGQDVINASNVPGQ